MIEMAIKPRRVLVLDDDEAILSVVSDVLAIIGYHSVTTTDHEEALEIVRSERADVMLLDLLMKPVSGLEVLKQLRAFSSIPVIVFSAHADIGATAMGQGADGYLSKPFRLHQISDTIGAACASRGARS